MRPAAPRREEHDTRASYEAAFVAWLQGFGLRATKAREVVRLVRRADVTLCDGEHRGEPCARVHYRTKYGRGVLRFYFHG